MAKQIRLELDGKEYTLEFTRKTAQMTESSGFNVNEVFDKPATMVPLLFAGAFKAHHPFMQPKQIETLLDKVEGKRDLINVLTDMYMEPVLAMVGAEETSGDAGNRNWTVSE